MGTFALNYKEEGGLLTQINFSSCCNVMASLWGSKITHSKTIPVEIYLSGEKLNYCINCGAEINPESLP